jgi:hypothetical protein
MMKNESPVAPSRVMYSLSWKKSCSEERKPKLMQLLKGLSKYGTDHFEDIGNFGKFWRWQVLQQRHAAEKEALLDPKEIKKVVY